MINLCRRDKGKKINLILHIRETSGEVDGEDDENDIALRVAEGPQAVVLLLARRVPQGKLNFFALELYLCHVVFEYGRDVCLNEGVNKMYEWENAKNGHRTSGKRFSA